MFRHAALSLIVGLLLLAGLAVLAACGSGATVTTIKVIQVTSLSVPAPTATLAATATITSTAQPTATASVTGTPAALPVTGSTATPAGAASTATPAALPTVAATPTAPPTAVPTAAPAAPAMANLANIQLALQPIATGLAEPVAIADAGDGSGRLFVVEKRGTIRIVQNGKLLAAPFLDITGRVGSSGSEQGLLGLAFHPDYARAGTFYVDYTDTSGNTVVSRFTAQPGSNQADPGSEKVILRVDQPFPNHNGGQLAFGPDGYLYIGLGDGGSEGDPLGNGQKGTTLLSKVLRIDVDHGDPYAIPRDNPFLNNPGVKPETWATGLRNPWRFSFDRATGDLYIGDVGQNKYEEIDFQPAGQGGQNYGWSIMEGKHCYRQQNCSQTGLTLPVAEYDHSQGCAVTGGYVYRGKQYPVLTGVYLFADWCSGRFWGLTHTAGGVWQMAQLTQAQISPTSFGQDQAGELYVVDGSGGGLYKITATAKTGG